MLLLMSVASVAGGAAAPITFTAITPTTLSFVAETTDSLEFTELAHA